MSDSRVSPVLRTRRRVLGTVASGLGLVAGCSGSSGDSRSGGRTDTRGERNTRRDTTATHGGVTLRVRGHVRTTEVLSSGDGTEPCVATVTPGSVRVFVSVGVVRRTATASDVGPTEVLDGAALSCGGTEFEFLSLQTVPGGDRSVNRYELGYLVPEGVDLTSCALDVAWQGGASREARFRLGLGERRRRDVSAYDPCDPATSFEVRITSDDGEVLLFGADAVDRVGPVRRRDGSYRFVIELTDEGARTVRTRLREAGALDDPDAATILVVLDGETVSELGLAPGLAARIDAGTWRGELQLQFSERATAERVRKALTGGS